MDGEFDREIDDDGWGPITGLRTVEEQVLALNKVIDRTHEPRSAAEEKSKLKAAVIKLMQEKKRSMQGQGNLKAEFWKKEEEAKQREEKEIEEGKTCGLINKGKHKKAQAKASEERAQWSKWAMWWQGVKHLMTEESKKQKIDNPPVPNPPPYSTACPSAPLTKPTPGIYPSLQITSGKIYIDNAQDSDWTESRSSISVTAASEITSHAPLPTPQRQDTAQKQTNHIEPEPFLLRGQRDGTNQEVQLGLSEADLIKWMRPKEKEGAKTPEGACGPDIDRWVQGAQGGKDKSEERKRLLREKLTQIQLQEEKEKIVEDKIARFLHEREDREGEIEMSAKGRWESGPYRDEEAEVAMHARGVWGEDNDGKALEQLEQEIEESHRVMKELTEKARMQTRSQTGHSSRPPIRYQLPLIQAGSSNTMQYRPFPIGDVQALVDKLPPVAEGGSLWLSQLDKLTAGQKLALGDFRAVISRCLTGSDVRDLEEDAGTNKDRDDIPFTTVSTKMGQAMRVKYPLPSAAAVPKLKWDTKQSPREYLDHSKDMWIKQTGCHPGKEGVQREWYRAAVLKGVPEEVRKAMENNPDMAGCDSTVWDRHLIHHLLRAQDKVEDESQTVKDLQAQLLKIQLAEARQKANDKKKPDKKVLVATQGAAGTPDLYPTPPWVQPPPYQNQNQQQRPTRGYGRGRGSWGGGRGRGGPPRGGQGRGRCYYCEETGHWVRDCPHIGEQKPPQPRGQSAPAARQLPAFGWERWDGEAHQQQ